MSNKEYLDKFKKLYQDKYNVTLSDEEATDLATHFLNLMTILIKPKREPRINHENNQVYLENEATR